VDRELTTADLLLGERLGDQLLGDRPGLAVLDRPADDVAAVLFPDPLCGRRRRRPALTGANGQVVAFSGT
jgi:hypothetical protein